MIDRVQIEQEIDFLTLETWDSMSIKELEQVKDNLMNRINEMSQYSEGLLYNDSGENLNKLEKYIMYRKGNDSSERVIL